MRKLVIAGAIGLLMTTAALAAEFKIARYTDRVHTGGSGPGTGFITSNMIKFQSLLDKPVLVNDIIINEKPACLDLEGYKRLGFLPKLPKKMELGDELKLTLQDDCNPIKIRIVTDQGEFVYRMN